MEMFLETERLKLRRITPNDAGNLFELDSDPEVVRYANPGGRTTPYEEIHDRVLPRILGYYERCEDRGFWAAIERSSGEFLGWFVFRPTGDGALAKLVADGPGDVELGYRLKRSAWGRGYATEGSRALIEKGFSKPDVERVVAVALTANTASVRVMEKAGLKLFKTLAYRMHPGEEVEAVGYALERDEYLSRKAAKT